MPSADANPLPGSELAAFVAAVEAASVHGAADALSLTPSAVTKRLQSLERRAGVALFERGRHGVRPTAAARLLYPEAKHALDALRSVEDALAGHRQQVDHALVLAASYTVGEFLLPGWLAAFRQLHPASRAQVAVVNSPAVLEAVRERRAAIGFVEGLDPLDGLDTLVVQRDAIVVVVAAGHRWRRRRALRPAELADEPYLTREQGSGTRAVASAALRRAGVELTPALEVASTQSLKRALLSGGFTLLSELVVATEVAAGTLHAIPLRELPLSRDLRAVRARAPRLTGDAARFWGWLRSSAGDRSV